MQARRALPQDEGTWELAREGCNTNASHLHIKDILLSSSLCLWHALPLLLGTDDLGRPLQADLGDRVAHSCTSQPPEALHTCY